ncbi:MAG: energy-coupling factor transporter transmembrane protein EcfT [Syntrophales bacterium]|nr:energy-coupling factor transporter transmembrane protein EcfT [Syntrophales bacterium]
MENSVSARGLRTHVLSKTFGFGIFVPGSSPIHRVDPRVKIVASVLLSLVTFQSSWHVLALLTVVFVAITLLARLNPAQIGSAMKPFFYFALIIFSLHVFFSDGEAIVSVGAARITWDGLLRGTFVVWQYLLLFYGGFLLTVTTPLSALVTGFNYLLGPLRRVGVPVQELAIMVVMALRFVPTFVDEYNRLRLAYLSRGGDFFGGDFKMRVVRTSRVTIPLMIGAFRRAEELARTMDARGYGLGKRTSLYDFRITVRDLIALSMVFVVVLCGVLL